MLPFLLYIRSRFFLQLNSRLLDTFEKFTYNIKILVVFLENDSNSAIRSWYPIFHG